MSAVTALSSERVSLRRWRDGDREAFAAMNSDARVMEFFRSRLSRAESDAMVDGIERHFSQHGFGLWALEVPDVAPLVGFVGLAVARFDAPFTPCVEVGWRLAFEYWGHGYATEAARLALATALARSHSRRSYPLHLRRTTVPEPSWSGSGCATTRPTISIIRQCRKVIRFDRMCFTGWAQARISACVELRGRRACGLGPGPALDVKFGCREKNGLTR
jgi:RimJ/RimL family protein N-acetyltransferase